MNPLTLVKRLQKINEREADLGLSDDASWHAKYKGSAYIYVGGFPFDLTEGDLLAVFAQYGEVVDVNLVKNKDTGKSRGFAFLAYEDQRSTTLAVDNLNGAQILGRVIKVDHVEKYKKLEEEDEETRLKKREERGVCRAFQRGGCTRGNACKFSHDEQRAANTGWGAEDQGSKWGHDKYEGSKENGQRFSVQAHSRSGNKDSTAKPRVNEKIVERNEGRERNSSKGYYEDNEPKSRKNFDRREDKRTSQHHVDKLEPTSRQELHRSERKRDYEPRSGEDMLGDKRSKRQTDDEEPKKSKDCDRRIEQRSRRHESESHQREYGDQREERRSGHDHSSHRSGDRNDHRHKSDR